MQNTGNVKITNIITVTITSNKSKKDRLQNIAYKVIERFWGCKILILPKSNQMCSNFITFAQILPHFCANFALMLLKFNQICLKLISFSQKVLLGDTTASPYPPASPALTALLQNVEH